MNETQRVGRIYKISKECTNMVYVGQTTLSLAERLGVHNSFAKRPAGEAYSCHRLYRLAGPLIIEELASISKLVGESEAAFKQRLGKLEHDYIKSTPFAVNKYGANYDRHSAESSACEVCGHRFSSCYIAKRHQDKGTLCRRYLYESACKALMNLPADIFS